MNLTPNGERALQVYGEGRQVPERAQDAMRAANAAVQRMIDASARLGPKHPDVDAAALDAERLFDVAGGLL